MTRITPYHQASDFHDYGSVYTKILIFQEQTLGWQLDIADTCINGGLPSMRHSGWAVLMMAFSYFEMIAKTQDGYAKEGKSEDYFRRGVLDVFPELSQDPRREEILKILYRSVRCGFYHAGVAQGRIRISSTCEVLSYDGKFVRINPHQLVPRLKEHLQRYLSQLRQPESSDMRERFQARFDYVRQLDPLN